MLNKAKQPESGDLCGNITKFGVAEGSPEPAGWKWSFHHPKRSDMPYSTPGDGCFVFISYCLMVLSHSKLRYMR